MLPGKDHKVGQAGRAWLDSSDSTDDPDDQDNSETSKNSLSGSLTNLYIDEDTGYSDIEDKQEDDPEEKSGKSEQVRGPQRKLSNAEIVENFTENSHDIVSDTWKSTSGEERSSHDVEISEEGLKRSREDLHSSVSGGKRSPSLAESRELDKLLESCGEKISLNIEKSDGNHTAVGRAAREVSEDGGTKLWNTEAVRRSLNLENFDLETFVNSSDENRRSLSLENFNIEVLFGESVQPLNLEGVDLESIRNEMWNDLADIIGEEKAQMLKWACESEKGEEKPKDVVRLVY